MYVIVEFDENSDGGLAIVNNNWLTPRKEHCFWPPYKSQNLFNKCLVSHNEEIKDSWQVYDINRCFYETNDIEIARRKLKVAEETSDLQSEVEEPSSRKRKIPRRLTYDSSDEETVSVHKRPPELKNWIKHYKANSSEVKDSGQFFNQIGSNLPQILNSDNSTLEKEKEREASCKGKLISDDFRFSEKTKSPAICASSDGTSIQNKLIQLLIHIKEQNNQILGLLSKSQAACVAAPVPELPVEFPVADLERITALEEFLANNNENPKLVAFLASLGGKDMKSKTNRILKTVLSDELAQKFSFFGKRNSKKAFSDLRMCQLIVEAVKSRTDATNTDIEDAIKVWLKHASERIITKRKKNMIV